MAKASGSQRVTIKKYGNRRLYDTSASKYITLDELAGRIRDGDEVRIVDARTAEDLTQATLVQIVVESRGAGRLLPTPLLIEMIRMGDSALAEFLGTWMLWALDAFATMRRTSMQAQRFGLGGRSPFAAMPWAGMIPGMGAWTGGWQPPPPPRSGGRAHRADHAEATGRGWEPEEGADWPGPAEEPADDEATEARDDIDELRRELAELRARMDRERKG